MGIQQSCCRQQALEVKMNIPLEPDTKPSDGFIIVDELSQHAAEFIAVSQSESLISMMSIMETRQCINTQLRNDLQQQLYELWESQKLEKIRNVFEDWSNCQSGQCKEGYGQYVDNEGIYWEGLFEKNELVKGVRISDDILWEGHFNQGLLVEGVIMRINGYKYSGQLQNGLKHGYGVEQTPDSSHYEGYFMNDCKHGKGLMQNVEGWIYDGDYVNGVMSGNGKQTYVDGRVYEGEFNNDMKNGLGIYHWPNQCKYIGNFVDDLKVGYGEFYWPDQRVYKGQFLKGVPNGFGIMSDSQGRRQDGVWVNGKYSIEQSQDRLSVMSSIKLTKYNK